MASVIFATRRTTKTAITTRKILRRKICKKEGNGRREKDERNVTNEGRNKQQILTNCLRRLLLLTRRTLHVRGLRLSLLMFLMLLVKDGALEARLQNVLHQQGHPQYLAVGHVSARERCAVSDCINGCPEDADGKSTIDE